MQFFYWNRSFELGIARIDKQHRELIELINELAAAIVEGGRLPAVQAILKRMLTYAATHFVDEERIMALTSLDPEEQRHHVLAHQGFTEKAREIAQRGDLMQAEVSQQVLDFLTTWLISHILGSDMKIARALNRMQIGAAPDQQPLFEFSPVEKMLLGALTETERRFRLISDHTPVLIWVSDPQGARSFFNRAWHDYVGISEEEAAEAHWSERVHPEDRVQYLATLKTLYGHPAASQTEYRLRGADGNYRWFLERILPRLDSEDCLAGFIASATDITEIKQAEALLTETNKHLEEEVARRTEQLEQLMLTDPLTGIGNRRLLMKKLAEEVTRAHRYQRPLTVCFFDIDHFKAVNDDFGHAVGDAALAGVASVLKNCLRSCDLVGRFGGEEFVVLMPETDAAIGIQVADRLRQEIETTTFAEVPRSITVSAGLAELNRKESAESIIERSDRALYQAKRTGRNRCCLDALYSAGSVSKMEG